MSTQELTIMMRCRVDSYETEITFSGDVDQLKRIAAKLASLGIEPTATVTAPIGKAPKQEPFYDGNGDACCPIHRTRPLRGPNQWGKLFCPAKADDGSYCKYTWRAE